MKFSLLTATTTMLAGMAICTTTLHAQCLSSQYFPAGFIPFERIYYISDANAAGDKLVVGKMTIDAYDTLSRLLYPTDANQLFCGKIELAKGFFANAYVPTPAERVGDFASSGFNGLLLDPSPDNPCSAFPGGIFPASRIPVPFAWRIAPPSSDASVPALEIQLSKVCYLPGDTVTVNSYLLENNGLNTVPVELKAWQRVPKTGIVPYDNQGSDGSLQLAPGFALDSGPFDWFSVTPDVVHGSYEFNSRLLNPITGADLSVRRNIFVIP